jgi:EpsI family protein
MTARLLIVTACFVVAMGFASRAARPEIVPLREPLRTLPFELGEWRGQDAKPFADDIVAVLGVDEYVSRWYATNDERLVSLYVGYYQSQRQGDSIHSPMNCLPGAGWQPVETGRTTIPIAGRAEPIAVNRVVIQKGLDRQLALYWYQSQGRVVANDAARLNRSDAALVRVIAPIRGAESSPDQATTDASGFVKALFQVLSNHLPS